MLHFETVHVCIDEGTMARGDSWAVIQPVWWSANIYDGPEQYEKSLQSFSRSQRLVFAVMWYRVEVNNGGHRQFYSNSAGIVWKDAQAAFHDLEMNQFARILEESAVRLGGSPSLDRKRRNLQLQTLAPNFEDLDQRLYEAEKNADLNGGIMNYIRTRPCDFYFEGSIKRVFLPGH